MDLARLRVKVFVDSADERTIIDTIGSGAAAGATTNPSLLRKAGVTDYLAFVERLTNSIQDAPLSFEVLADDLSEMFRQAKILSGVADNVYVKIPITNTHGDTTLPLVHDLLHDGVKVNVTAVFTFAQIESTINTCQSSDTPSIVSIFCGRIADAGLNPEDTILFAANITQWLIPRRKPFLLWASAREPYNVMQAERSGAEIITLFPEMLKKLHLFGKDLNVFSWETIKMFRDDAIASGLTL